VLDKQGIKATGNSMIVYTSTDDTGFTFLAQIPVDQDVKSLAKDMSMGKSPDGKALKFVHRGSYDNMDNTYEAITNHLDDKKLEGQGHLHRGIHHRSPEDGGGQAGDQRLLAAAVRRCERPRSPLPLLRTWLAAPALAQTVAAACDFRDRRSERVGGARSGPDRRRRDIGSQDRARGVGRQQRGDGQGAAGAQGAPVSRKRTTRPRGCRCSRNLRPRPKPSERAPGIVSFRASNRVTVKVRDVTKVANVIDVLVGAGANEIGGINFTVTQASKHARRSPREGDRGCPPQGRDLRQGRRRDARRADQHFRGRRAHADVRGKMARRWPPAPRWRKAKRRYR
jgi:hypothetical protein